MPSYVHLATKLSMFASISSILLLFCSTLSEPFSLDGKQNTSNKSIQRYAASNNVCNTEKCKEIAQQFRLSMNIEADPCDDFFEYACGLWIRLNPTDDDKAGSSNFVQVAVRTNNELKTMMNNLNPDEYEERSMKLLINVYKKCMDENAIEEAGVDPLKKEIDEIFGAHPYDIGHTLQSRATVMTLNESLGSLAARLWLEHSTNVLITSFVIEDFYDSKTNTLQIGEAPLGLYGKSEDYYLKEGEPYQTVRDAYLGLMINVSAILWNTEMPWQSTEQQVKDAQEVFDFEVELAKINTQARELRDLNKEHHKMRLSELEFLGRNFDLIEYLSHFSPMEEVNIEPEYIKKLNTLLERSKPSVVKGHMLWMLILKSLEYLSRNISDHYYYLMKVYPGVSKKTDRADYCMAFVEGHKENNNENLGYALGRLFIDKKNFTRDTRIHVKRMIKELYSTLRARLEKNEWMDNETKSAAIRKIDKQIMNIGYPDFLETDLDAVYLPLLQEMDGFKGTRILPNDRFYEITRKLGAWKYQKLNKEIGKRYNHHMFVGSPVVVNAWYSPLRNSITLPAVIFQSPSYDPGFPMAVNFGRIGSVIGHEITHGFDDQGSRFDGDGNLVNWWTNSSREEFEKRVQCVVVQYSKLCYPDLGEDICVKGNDTRSENIADIGGLIQAFYAYRNYMKGKEDLVLPSFEDFTPEQIFFISNAHSLCSKLGVPSLINVIETDVHSPDRDRVIGPMQNLDEFSKAFNCPTGSRMNPKHKCVIW